jgi:hypothetical protein
MTQTRKNLLTGCILALLGAGGAFFIGREQDRIRSLYGAKPQTLSVAELGARGYGNNIWLDLTDVELGKKFVIESRKGRMSAVWIPAFPRGEATKAKSIQVVLRSTRCRSDADIAERFANRATFRGAVINPTLLRPHDPYRRLLQENYPGLTLPSTIWEVDVEYSKPSSQWANGFYAATGGLGVLGLVCGLGLLSGTWGRRPKVAPPAR